MEVLKCENLKKKIKDKVIVENISFSINRGFIKKVGGTDID